MKLLTTEQQTELRILIGELAGRVDNTDTQALYNQCIFWEIELKPKRTRKKKGGLDLNTEEGVIEQAYQEHTGNI